MFMPQPKQIICYKFARPCGISTYGLEKLKINASIGLYASLILVNPQTPNPRGAHGGFKDEDPLNDIIETFNNRWFQGWEATPDKQQVKL